MEFLGVLTGIMACAIGWLIYDRKRHLETVTEPQSKLIFELADRIVALEKRRTMPPLDEKSQTPDPVRPRIRPRTMSEVIRQAEEGATGTKASA